ncbi:MAG: FAD/FMN-containing dehydrogenase [Limisphaerales bacterium]|jgi:FAD/FMN-containing dehydrogenase
MADLPISDASGEQISLSATNVTSLQSQLSGDVLLVGTAEYEMARTVWNAMVDQRPGLIARCLNTADVVAAVQFARTHDLLVSVKSGGHNIAGKSVTTDSFTIDLSQMKGIEVDAEQRTAKCQSGLKLGELDAGTQAFGLATVQGIATDTGMAGVVIGGGYGWLAGKYGMTCDNLVSAELVLADGNVVTASTEENEDLFWGIRGGGGNFGIVTSFEFRLHPVTMVLGGMIIHPRSEAQNFLRFFRDYANSAPDELTMVALLLHTPDGVPAVAAAVCCCGPADQAKETLRPLKEFGSPLADSIAPVPYVEQQALLDDAWPPGDSYYWKTSLVSTLSDAAIDVLIEQAAKAPNPMSAIALQQLHGVATRVSSTDTAFAHRFDHYNFIPMARWNDPADADRNVEWAREVWQAMQPHSDEAVYGNDLGDEGDDRLRAAYGINYERLVRLKKQYDPGNLFRLNQNIKPGV